MWGEQAMLPKTWIPNVRWYEVHVRVVRGIFETDQRRTLIKVPYPRQKLETKRQSPINRHLFGEVFPDEPKVTAPDAW
jgi:hypothetical protein